MFLYDLISLNNSYDTITFVLKEIECANYPLDGTSITIKNLIIKINGRLSSDKNSLDKEITVLFSYNNKTYGYDSGVIHKYFTSPDNISPFNTPMTSPVTPPASPVTPEQLEKLATKILQPYGTQDA